jgi:hypothetical protein
MKNPSPTYYPEEPSAIKNIGRYTAATVEYSSLVMLSVFERGGRSINSGVDAVVSPYKKAAKKIDSAAVAPFKSLAKGFKKIATPFTWTARQVTETGGRGVPVHLDKKSMSALQTSLQRIEERLANIEKKGFSVTAGAPAPTANDFKKKPSKEKNMLLRAILEDSKHTLED